MGVNVVKTTLVSWFRALSDEKKRNLKKYNPVLFNSLNAEMLKSMSFKEWRYEKSKQPPIKQTSKRRRFFEGIDNIVVANNSNTGDNFTHSCGDISDCCDCGCDF